MKKFTLILFLLLHICAALNSQVIRNSRGRGEGEHRLYLGLSPYLFAPKKAEFCFETTFDYINGLRKGALFRFDGRVELSKLFNFSSALTLITDRSVLNSFTLGWQLQPLSFFTFHLNYRLQNYSQYRIVEHNISTIAEFYLKIKKIARLSLELGVNQRFIDLDINDGGLRYKRDWLYDVFVNYRLQALFHPARLYSLGLAIGNINRNETLTVGYWQVEFLNIFRLPYNLEITASIGFAYAGSLSLAGYINRVWGTIGVKYNLYFN